MRSWRIRDCFSSGFVGQIASDTLQHGHNDLQVVGDAVLQFLEEAFLRSVGEFEPLDEVRHPSDQHDV